MWGTIKNYNRRDDGSDHGMAKKLAQYIKKFMDELADDDEDPIYVRNIMIISSKIARCFPLVELEEKNLEVVKKIMKNPDVDSYFKQEFGHHASKFFHQYNVKESVEISKLALANSLGAISYEGDIE